MASGTKAGNASKSSAAQPNGAQSNGNAPKVVGPNVKGHREEYQLVRRLQSALFGGVYEAKGLSSGRDFAIKVLHKSELSKAQESNSIEFCEVPLSEIRFAELMRGDQHVMEPEEHFEDAYCFYVVFELARGGDLLEALKQKPHGFDEPHAQFLIMQAAKGLAYLHGRRVAMQDVSLENMLLHVDEASGYYQVKVCDPGQAVVFEVDENGEEMDVSFRGLVGKSFRPPELHDQMPYVSTKVDSWCLGWSTFYLLTAQPLFMSADPQQQDADWLLFQQGDFAGLFQQKSNLCSPVGLDFIFRLLQLEPKKRLSIVDALNHPWLADKKICPVPAPKELLPESARRTSNRAEEVPANKELESGGRSPRGGQSGAGSTVAPPASNNSGGLSPSSAGSMYVGGSDLPTWAGANAFGGPQAQLRVRSPPRSPRVGPSGPRMPTDRRRPMAPPGRSAYVIATAHSPPPAMSQTSMMGSGFPSRASGIVRTASPLQSSAMPTAVLRSSSPTHMPGANGEVPSHYDYGRPPIFVTPRSGSRTSLTQADLENPHTRGPAWAFRSEGADGLRMGSADAAFDMQGRPRALSPSHSGMIAMSPQRASGPSAPSGWAPVGRPAHSPSRGHGAIQFPRSLSPMQLAEQGVNLHGSAAMRTASPVSARLPVGPGMPGPRTQEGLCFSWAQAPQMFSPRTGSQAGTAMHRTASPVMLKGTGPKSGFAWSPDPPSPRVSGRSYSPGAGHMQSVGTLPRWFSPQ